MKKSILIVGAGFGQLPAISKAKDLGLEVIVVDRNPLAVGAGCADFFYEIDVVDKDAILDVAKKHNIKGIMTMQSDLPVPSVGYVVDHLALKGVSRDVAETCSNKIKTRIKLHQTNASQPKFLMASGLSDVVNACDKIGYPCVVKSPDSSGSRGVTKVSSSLEVESAFFEAQNNTGGTEILIEEFVEGLEFGAQTFSVNGKCELVLLHNDTLSSPPFMIPTGHSFPLAHLNSTEKERAIRDIKHAVEVLGLTDGPANVDVILDKKDNCIKILEIGARIGATCLPELVLYHTGIDWVKATILNAIGEQVDITSTYEKPVAASILEAPCDGNFKGFELEDGIALDDLLEFEISATVEERVNSLRKGTDRIGKIIAYGDTARDAERKLSEIKSKILIKVENHESLDSN